MTEADNNEDVIARLLERRFLVFNAASYYPQALQDDVIGVFSSEEAAVAFAAEVWPIDEVVVFDHAYGRIVWSSRNRRYTGDN